MRASNEIDWAAYAQPWGQSPDTVPGLLARLVSIEDGSRDDLRNRLLTALGNDHAGTYYPIAVPAVRCLAEVLRAGTDAARWQALEIAIDLLGSFEPDPNVVPVSDREALNTALREAGELLRPLAQQLADGSRGSAAVHKSARELLTIL